MVEVKLNFEEMKLVPVGIKEVSVDGIKIDFVGETIKKLNRDNSRMVVCNATVTGLVPSDRFVEIHIISLYKNIDTGEMLTVHERTIGKVEKIYNNIQNGSIHTYEIAFDGIMPFDYTVEQKTKEEIFEDKIKCLENKIIELENKDKMLVEMVRKTSVKVNDVKDNIINALK